MTALCNAWTMSRNIRIQHFGLICQAEMSGSSISDEAVSTITSGDCFGPSRLLVTHFCHRGR